MKYLLILCLPFLFAMDGENVRSGQDYALFIAIDDYEDWPDLRNPVSDANAIAQELTNNYNFSTEVLTNPSREEIYDKLAEYRQRDFGAEDQLFIFFSGHGSFDEETTEGFFVPREGLQDDEYHNTHIPHTRLELKVENIPCDHILLVIDACYSGTFDRAVAQERGAVGNRPAAIEMDFRPAFIQQTLQKKSRLVLTSGGKERTPDGDRFSPLTEHLLEALSNFGLGDGILSFAELTGLMQPVEPKPHFASFGSHAPGGEFLFVNRLVTEVPIVEEIVDKEGTEQEEVTPIEEVEVPDKEEETTPSPDLGALGLHSSPYTSEVYEKIYFTLELNGLIWINENLVESTTTSRSRQSGTREQVSPSRSRTAEKKSHSRSTTTAATITNTHLLYDNDEENRDTYGYLYRWDKANSACKRLGRSWRLPTVKEWESLLQIYAEAGGYTSFEEAGDLMQEGTHKGLNIKLGGMVEGEQNFRQLGKFGMYATSDITWDGNPRFILFDHEGTISVQSTDKDTTPGFSCRCVKEL